MPQKHIAIICSNLNFAGGYERIVVETANLFASEGLRVTLILLAETTESFYPIHPNIAIIQKDIHFGITEKGNPVSRKLKLLGHLRSLKKISRDLRADVLICTGYHFAVSAILCGAKKYSKVVAWEHTHYGSLKPNLFWKTLLRLTYPRLHTIVCLNKREEAYFKKFANTCIIPNFASNKLRTYSQLDSKTILTVATLIPRKGIDFLIQSAKDVLLTHPDWKWKLIGSGPMKDLVIDFINTESLYERLILEHPVSSHIENEYLNASMFVLTSRSETLPMVLIEAITHGLPCVSFDCPTGPSDIITHKEDGLLVETENTTKLTEAISLLIEDEEKRKQMGANAIKNSKRFSSETIYQLWKQLLCFDKQSA
jgi:glycosyltransferase involved in cell wall biosynthesis